MPDVDPADEALFDPAQLLATLTGNPRTARSITELVRTEITDTVCQLLPGADNAVAHRWLYASTVFLLEAGPKWVKRLDKGIAEARTYASAVPAALMASMHVELAGRYFAAHPEAPLDRHVFTGPAQPPVPSDVLRESRETWDKAAAFMWGHYKVPPRTVGQVRDTMTRVVCGAVEEPGNEAWGGWILLAALTAMNAHRKVLPEPGRTDSWRPPRNRARADESAVAFQFGRAFAVTLAQGLLDPAKD